MEGGDGHAKISQSELSRRSGVPQPTIARILKGGGPKGPETDTLMKLAHALGVEFMWLQSGDEPKQAGGQPPIQKTGISAVPARQQAFKRHWLDQDEADHLADYRSLSERSRNRLRTIIRGMKRDSVSSDESNDS